MHFAQSCKNIKNLLIFQKKCGIISTLQKIIGKSTHSLTDKIPDSGSGAGGSIPSGCIKFLKLLFYFRRQLAKQPRRADIWRMPRGSDTMPLGPKNKLGHAPQLAAGYLVGADN